MTLPMATTLGRIATYFEGLLIIFPITLWLDGLVRSRDK